MPDDGQHYRPRYKKPAFDKPKRVKLADGYRNNHSLVATWISKKDFEFLTQQATKHKVGLSAYVRSILIDAIQDELFNEPLTKVDFDFFPDDWDERQRSGLSAYIRGVVVDELTKNKVV